MHFDQEVAELVKAVSEWMLNQDRPDKWTRLIVSLGALYNTELINERSNFNRKMWFFPSETHRIEHLATIQLQILLAPNFRWS